MYAVVSTGGKQYRLKEGDIVDVERFSGEVGEQVVFDQVLFLGGDDQLAAGNPVVEGARVVGTIIEQGKGDKVVVFKFKKRKMYRRRTGHRQSLTRVRIEEIQPAEEPARKARKAAEQPEQPAATKKTAAAAPAEEAAAAPAGRPRKKAEPAEKPEE